MTDKMLLDMFDGPRCPKVFEALSASNRARLIKSGAIQERYAPKEGQLKRLAKEGKIVVETVSRYRWHGPDDENPWANTPTKEWHVWLP